MPRQIWKAARRLPETATRDLISAGWAERPRGRPKAGVDGLVALMPAQLTEASLPPCRRACGADPVDVGDGKATAEANDGPLSLASATEMGADVRAGEAEEVRGGREEEDSNRAGALREARAFKARCSPKLLALLEHLGPNGTGAKWAASLDQCQQGLL